MAKSHVRYPFMADRVRILWVRSQSVLLRLLSINILREVCAYFGSPGAVISVREGAVYSFNTVARKWEVCVYLSGRLPVLTGSTYICTSYKDIFVLGGFDRSETATNSASLIVEGSVKPLKHMVSRRGQMGAIWACQSVHVFGGFDEKPLSASESFDGKDWAELPRMKTSRYNFNPCLHEGLVYICGAAIAVEVFDPKAREFTHVDMKLRQGVNSWSCCMLSLDGALITLGHDFVYHWRTDTQSARKTRFTWSCCEPAVQDGVVYLVDNRREKKTLCIGVRAADGVVVCEKQFP